MRRVAPPTVQMLDLGDGGGAVISALIYLVLGPYRYGKDIGAVPQPGSASSSVRPIEFATRSET